MGDGIPSSVVVVIEIEIVDADVLVNVSMELVEDVVAAPSCPQAAAAMNTTRRTAGRRFMADEG
jgi:hypothetical protein